MQHHRHHYLLANAILETQHKEGMTNVLGGVGLGTGYIDCGKSLVVFLHLPDILLGTRDELLAVVAGDTVGTIETVDISLVLAVAQIFIIYLGGFACQFLRLRSLCLAARRER